MKLSQQSQSVIESAIRKAIGKFACGCEQTIVTDIHIQPNQNSGELCIFDDEDDELANVLIEEWSAYENDDFYENAERILRPILCRRKAENLTNSPSSSRILLSWLMKKERPLPNCFW